MPEKAAEALAIEICSYGDIAYPKSVPMPATEPEPEPQKEQEQEQTINEFMKHIYHIDHMVKAVAKMPDPYRTSYEKYERS